MPEFPAYFSAERNEYIFDKRSVVPEMTAVQEVEAVAPVLSVNEENVQEKALRTKNANTQINLGIRTSALRCYPLQKKHDLGYTSPFSSPLSDLGTYGIGYFAIFK